MKEMLILSRALNSEDLPDTEWLISVNRLPAKAMVQWSCYVTAKKCPIIICDIGKSLQQLLLDRCRVAEMREKRLTLKWM